MPKSTTRARWRRWCAAAVLPAVRERADPYSASPQSLPGYKTTYKILKPGSGAAVKAGANATVHATGVIKETGKKFWSTKDPGQQPFSYKAGVGQVITGWDQGLLGMQIGEERELCIPAEEGYGEAPPPCVCPPSRRGRRLPHWS